MNNHLTAAAVAFVVAVPALTVARRLAIHWKLYDGSGSLKIHSRPIPRLGGLALVPAVVAGWLGATGSLSAREGAFLLALMLVWLAGAIDDLRGLSPMIRLTAQSAASVVLLSGGYRLAGPWPVALSPLVTFALVIVFVNAFNFLDGSDGLAGGTAAAIAAGYLLLGSTAMGTSGAAVMAALIGAGLAFLLYNFPPANMFMGDAGSTSLGFLVAVGAMEFSAGVAARRLWAVPFVVAAIPLLDFMATIARRAARGRSIFQGDRGHYYDVLLAHGWTPRRVALSTYGATSVLITLGYMLLSYGSRS
jgi:UDP-GlcNAc:undecaprenyl-phosphate/decaprenyl-phosphate GlcNAc-1-phosphate transferase